MLFIFTFILIYNRYLIYIIYIKGNKDKKKKKKKKDLIYMYFFLFADINTFSYHYLIYFNKTNENKADINLFPKVIWYILIKLMKMKN